jgi:hypothetical protein
MASNCVAGGPNTTLPGRGGGPFQKYFKEHLDQFANGGIFNPNDSAIVAKFVIRNQSELLVGNSGPQAQRQHVFRPPPPPNPPLCIVAIPIKAHGDVFFAYI